MINPKDVVTIKVPYPDISAGLAQQAHMYICYRNNQESKHLVKCQRFKGYMLEKDFMKHCVQEPADLTRNPFKAFTVIDCDKLFLFQGVKIPLVLRTKSRPDICQDLFNTVNTELVTDGYEEHSIEVAPLLELNFLIQGA